MFVVSFGRRFFEHLFCIAFGSVFDICLDRQLGDDLISTRDTLKKNKVLQVPTLLRFYLFVHRRWVNDSIHSK